MLLNQELIRLNELLKDKDEQIQGLRGSEFRLGQQLKELKQCESEGRQMRNALEAKQREVDQWRSSASRLEEEVCRGKEL